MCSSGSEPETTAPFLLRCRNHVISKSKLHKNVYKLDQTLRSYDDDHLIHVFLFFICYYYYYHYYFIASPRWFLPHIYSNFENTFFGLSNLELFIESLYAWNICLHVFFVFSYIYTYFLLLLSLLLLDKLQRWSFLSILFWSKFRFFETVLWHFSQYKKLYSSEIL